MTIVDAAAIRDLYRQMKNTFATTGNEAIYLRPELKTLLFGDVTHLDIDGIRLPIIADHHIPETDLGENTQSSELYILDQAAYAAALRDSLVNH